MFGITLKQFQRTYPGNFSWNFPLCLKSSNDFKVKNYSNIYLTGQYQFSDIFNFDSSRLKGINISTYLKYGEDYLKFNIADSTPYSEDSRYADYINYGFGSFTNTADGSTKFTLSILDDNTCRIFYTYNYIKYYLVADINQKASFIKEKLLSFNSDSVNPQDFKYLFSEKRNAIQFFKDTPDGYFYMTREGNELSLFELEDNNAVTYVSKTPFTIDRNIYTYPDTTLNTSFICYNNDNSIDESKSLFNLNNNFLLHRKYSDIGSIVDIIPLKNQLLQDDVFSSCNVLLSSNSKNLFVDGLREYTSINQDIKEENTEELELNYVFYNKSYKIKPGINEIIAPDSLYPFSKLNINDAKFISSGSFAFNTPQYSDKVYSLSEDSHNLLNGQYLLCTWLSGAPNSKEKVWVDRYYYPDRATKQEAISGRNTVEGTYDDLIENLIQTNIDIKNSVDTKKFFDKKSDLVFESGKTYTYNRISSQELPGIISNVSSSEVNYFKKINNSNKFTFGFYFDGDSTNWTVYSDINAIDCGLKIQKTNQILTLNYTLFDPSDNTYLNYSISSDIKQLKENFVCVSIDAIKGIGYFFLNNIVIKTFDIPIYQYVKKQLIYGDFYINFNNTKLNIYKSDKVKVPFLSTNYTDSNLVFIIPILDNKSNIDNIYITLPCGMSNSIDNIEYLQSVCGSSTFKSNNININLKNINIQNENILQGIKDSITSSVRGVLPVNTSINTITFPNYK